MPTLSVVISAYNEEARIEKTLQSSKFADEIIFVDNSSTDATASKATKYTKKLFVRKNNPMLNVNKNFGFTKATGDWILLLDGDEQVSEDLQKEIVIAIKNASPELTGFWIPRKNIIFGKWIQNSIWWPDYQLRLFRKHAGKFPEKHVHEMIDLTGQTEKLTHPLIHDNYSSISQYLQKLDNIYTENEAQLLFDSGKKVTWIDVIKFPFDDFLKTFFAQKGYKDGLHGLLLSLLQAFYAIIVFAKVWEKQGFIEYNSPHFLSEFYGLVKKLGKELEYWFLTALIDNTSNAIKKLYLRCLRKLQQKQVE